MSWYLYPAYCALIILLFLLVLSVINTLLPVPFIPTLKKTARKMIELGGLQPDDVVFDLGSGDGRLVVMAAQKGVKSAVGFEINPVMNIAARLRARLSRVQNTIFITQNIFDADLKQCSKLFIYMSGPVMQKLEEKVMNEMKSGSLVVSNTFSFKKLEPVRIDGNIRVYRIP